MWYKLDVNLQVMTQFIDLLYICSNKRIKSNITPCGGVNLSRLDAFFNLQTDTIVMEKGKNTFLFWKLW